MSDVDSEIDSRFMKNALMEATKGLGRTSPNPTVGCVITKGGKIIAYVTDFNISGDSIRVWCTKWDKKNKYTKNYIKI